MEVGDQHTGDRVNRLVPRQAFVPEPGEGGGDHGIALSELVFEDAVEDGVEGG